MHLSHRHVPPYDATHRAAHAAPFPRQFVGGGLYVCASVVRTWYQRSCQRRALAELDDRMLRDIGVTRSQAQREAAKLFWRASEAQSTQWHLAAG
jgi:uncharacterized protein YjiS (DUF1127 family)